MIKHRSYSVIVFLISFMFSLNVIAQSDSIIKQTYTCDFGSYRHHYYFPISNISFQSNLIKQSRFRFNLRYRAYGNTLFFSKYAFDLTPQLEYLIPIKSKNLRLLCGLGLDGRIRLLQDSRSEARSGVEPIVSGTILYSYKRVSLALPLWTRYYNNGYSIEIIPQISLKMNKRISVFYRLEETYLATYKTNTQELFHDMFLGLSYSVNK